MLAQISIERDLDLYKTDWRIENSMFIQIGVLGGILVLLWIIAFVIDFILTNKRFQNYMASELYYVPDDVNDAQANENAKPLSTGCCGNNLSRQRYYIPRDFHNEIIDEDQKVLNRNKVACWCKFFNICRLCFCMMKRRRIVRIF